MVGNDLDLSPAALATHAGVCGKGQAMPVSDASPTFKTRLFVSV